MQVANVSMSIHSDGDRTVVEASYHSYEFPAIHANASSGREPGDKTDRVVGEALAVSRALEKISKKLAKQAAGRIKHKEDNAKHALEIFEAQQNTDAQEALYRYLTTGRR